MRGDAVGFEGDEIVAWGGEGSTLSATIERIAEGAEIVTVLQGADARIPMDELPIDLPAAWPWRSSGAASPTTGG